jgi:hypothetical protein
VVKEKNGGGGWTWSLISTQGGQDGHQKVLEETGHLESDRTIEIDL